MINGASDPNRTREALAFIDSSCRESWVTVAYALNSEFGEAGFDLFDEWSQQAHNYEAKAAKHTYQSAKNSGGVSAGSLYYMAKQNGWQPSNTLTQDEREALTIKMAEQQNEREAKREAEQASEAKRQANSRARILAQWDKAKPLSKPHPYLVSKGLENLDLPIRVLDSELLIPMYSPKGGIQSLQSIGTDGSKTFASGCSAAGAYFPIDGNSEKPLLICEGLATGGSLALATGWQVAVAFSAGNLKKIAQVMRSKYPSRLITICADHDHERTNAGIKAANEAAKTVGALVCLPTFNQPAGKTDFNDLHQEQGLEAVRLIVEAATPPQEAWEEPPPLTTPEHSEIDFPMEALGPLLSDAAMAIWEHIQCADATAAFVVLGAASFAVQAHYKAPHPKRSSGMPASLYLLTLAESSERKSTAEGLALLPIKALEREFASQHREATEHWASEQKEIRKKKAKGGN